MSPPRTVANHRDGCHCVPYVAAPVRARVYISVTMGTVAEVRGGSRRRLPYIWHMRGEEHVAGPNEWPEYLRQIRSEIPRNFTFFGRV